jgi:hypothetical protein
MESEQFISVELQNLEIAMVQVTAIVAMSEIQKPVACGDEECHTFLGMKRKPKQVKWVRLTKICLDGGWIVLTKTSLTAIMDKINRKESADGI